LYYNSWATPPPGFDPIFRDIATKRGVVEKLGEVLDIFLEKPQKTEENFTSRSGLIPKTPLDTPLPLMIV